MNTKNDIQSALQNSYESLLFGYAAGTLDEAQNLIVAAHLTYSSSARNFVKSCECVGGALIESQCEPVAMHDGALANVLSHLDSSDTHTAPKDFDTTHSSNIVDCELPSPLRQTLQAGPSAEKWNYLFPGMRAINLELDCKKSTARFMKAKPGCKSPHHSHGDMEITLVLDGSFHDETGHYKRGDLVVTDEDTHHHTPIACPEQGCLCFVVTSAPVKLTGIARLLNPFLKP